MATTKTPKIEFLGPPLTSLQSWEPVVTWKEYKSKSLKLSKPTPRPYLTFIVGTFVESSQCSASTKSNVLVLFFSDKTALNANAMFDLGDKGLLPTILL